MSVIESVGPTISGRLSNRKRAGGPARFTLPAAARPGPSAAAEAPQAVGPGLLVLQEVGLDPARDRAARRHGRALLAALTRVQHQLLGGSEPPALEELANLAAHAPSASDPALAAALHGVIVRARVELARRGR